MQTWKCKTFWMLHTRFPENPWWWIRIYNAIYFEFRLFNNSVHLLRHGHNRLVCNETIVINEKIHIVIMYEANANEHKPRDKQKHTKHVQ